jgi:hypothetical protein
VATRRISASALVIIAAICGVLAYGALRNLWAAYHDSPVYTYVLTGGAWMFLALMFVIVAIRLSRSRP